jgi:hypothetical protein
VTLTPLQMKKNRPAVLLTVLCRPPCRALLALVLAETSTLACAAPKRPTESAAHDGNGGDAYGPIRVKVTWWQGCRRAMPEYDDCRAAAATHGAPLTEVMLAGQAGRLNEYWGVMMPECCMWWQRLALTGLVDAHGTGLFPVGAWRTMLWTYIGSAVGGGGRVGAGLALGRQEAAHPLTRAKAYGPSAVGRPRASPHLAVRAHGTAGGAAAGRGGRRGRGRGARAGRAGAPAPHQH